MGTRKESLAREVGEKIGGNRGEKREEKMRRQREIDILRMCSHSENADNVPV